MDRNIDTIQEESCKELLDLGLCNPLISHSQRAKQVKVVDELATETYRILVVNGSVMSFDFTVDEEKLESEVSDAVDVGEPLVQQVKIYPHILESYQITDAMSEEEKLAIIQREFDRLYDPNYPVRNRLETLDSVEVVRIIREALKR